MLDTKITCADCKKIYIYNRKTRKGATRTVCSSCRVQRRRRKLKTMMVEYKGGKCYLCGYNKCVGALEFHHINPENKSFSLSGSGYTRKWEVLLPELDKTLMLCANCHREVEAGLHILKLH